MIYWYRVRLWSIHKNALRVKWAVMNSQLLILVVMVYVVRTGKGVIMLCLMVKLLKKDRHFMNLK